MEKGINEFSPKPMSWNNYDGSLFQWQNGKGV